MLRTRVLKGRKCYGKCCGHAEANTVHSKLTRASPFLVLNQAVTLPEHQRRSASSMLLTWPFERADKGSAVCYLETEADGKMMALYEKSGYVKVDECEVPLAVCGLESGGVRALRNHDSSFGNRNFACVN